LDLIQPGGGDYRRAAGLVVCGLILVTTISLAEIGLAN
jgi:hypothetical protein